MTIVTIDPKTRVARRQPDDAAVDPKKSRRPAWNGVKAAAEVDGPDSRSEEGTGDAHPSTKAPAPANDHGPRRSAIVTVRDRKTVQHRRERRRWPATGRSGRRSSPSGGMART